MPFEMRCPSCNAKLRVPNKVAARSARFFCPKCQAPIEKRSPAISPPAPGTAPIPLGILEPDMKPRHPAPPPIPAGIPMGILDDAIVVPLSREERVRASDMAEPPHTGSVQEPPPQRLFPAAESETIRQDALPPAAPASTAKWESPEPALGPEDFEVVSPADSNITEIIDAELIDDLEPAAAPPPPAQPRQRRTEMDFLSDREKEELGRLIKSPEWHSVRTGLNLVYIGACLAIACFNIVLVTLALHAVLHLANGAAWGRAVVLIGVAASTLVGAGAGIVSLTGHVYCSYAPTRRGAQQLAIVATSLHGAAVFFSLFGVVMNMAGAPVLALVLLIGAAFLGAAHPIAFLLFLRALALVVKKRWLAESIRNLCIAIGASIVAYPVFVFIVVIIAGSAAGDATSGSLKDPAVFFAGLRLGGVINIVVGFAWMIALFVWFMNSLIDVRHELLRETGSGWEGGRPLWVPLLTAAGVLFGTFIVLVGIMQLWGEPGVRSQESGVRSQEQAAEPSAPTPDP